MKREKIKKCIILLIIICCTFLAVNCFFLKKTVNITTAASINGKSETIFTNESEQYIIKNKPVVSAEGAALYNCSTNEFIYEKNGKEKLYPASTTKIMTALITLEILDEIGLTTESEVRVPEEAVGTEGSSIYLKKGEKISIEALLYGLMLKSGNDSAETLACVMSGDRDNFIERMNERALKIGCIDTVFKNPSGLYDEKHYTTAQDLALIAAEAMKRDDFRKIVSSKEWESKSGNRAFKNKNKTVFQYDGGDGIKIGFTKKSGRTLVASAERNGARLIAVVLNDSNWFEDAYSLLDYGFEVCRCN